MITFNYHTHTTRCGHAFGSDEEYVLAAIKAGYKTLGFSDHAPYKNLPRRKINMHWSDLKDYLDSLNYLKEKYKDIIDIKIGFESEFIPKEEIIKEKEELRSMVDYMILGQHYDDELLNGFFAFDHNSEEEILRYAYTLCEAVDTGLFSIIAHPDVIMTNQLEFSKSCEIAAHMIGKKAQEKNIPLELNVHGVYRGRTYNNRFNYPNYDFWKILSSYDVKAVVGVDAHKPEHILDFEIINEGIDALKDLPIKIIDEPFI